MTEKNTIIVNDMTCDHCVGTVRTALLRAKQRLKEIDVKEKEASQHEPGER